jgi:hypothetical protein
MNIGKQQWETLFDLWIVKGVTIDKKITHRMIPEKIWKN